LPVIGFCDPARWWGSAVSAGRRPADKARQGAFDVLMRLIEASGAVISEDELLSRVWQDRIVDENRQRATRLPRCAKDLVSTDRELIAMVADQITGCRRDPRALQVRTGRPHWALGGLPRRVTANEDDGAVSDQCALINVLCSDQCALGGAAG